MSFDNFERDLGMGGARTFDPIEKLGMDAMRCHSKFGDAARDFAAGLIGGNDVGGDLGNRLETKPETDAGAAHWQDMREANPGLSDGQILDLNFPEK